MKSKSTVKRLTAVGSLSVALRFPTATSVVLTTSLPANFNLPHLPQTIYYLMVDVIASLNPVSYLHW